MYEDTRAVVPAGISKVVYVDLDKHDFSIVKKHMACRRNDLYNDELSVERFNNICVVALSHVSTRMFGRHAFGIYGASCKLYTEHDFVSFNRESVSNPEVIYDSRLTDIPLTEVFDMSKTYIGIIAHIDISVNKDVITVRIAKITCDYIFDGPPRDSYPAAKFNNVDAHFAGFRLTADRFSVLDKTTAILIHNDSQLMEASTQYYYSVPPSQYTRRLAIGNTSLQYVYAIAYRERMHVSMYNAVNGKGDDVI